MNEEPENEKTVIEYEQVSLKVPKRIRDFLRLMQKVNHEGPEEYLAYNAVMAVRADIDAGDVFIPEPHEVAELHGLNPVFREILGDSC